jgi:hypothetical protein
MENTIEKSGAIIAKAYLKQNNSKTYDLRSFEYSNKHQMMLKVQSVISLLDKNSLNEDEKDAIKKLKDVRVIEEGIEFVKELISK